MFPSLSDLGWLGFAVATVASIVLAGIWFGAVVAKPYLAALGRDADSLPAPTPLRQVGPVVCLVPVTLTSTWLVAALGVTAIGDAVVLGLVVGVGYLTAMTFQIAINPNFPRPLFYGVLNAPFFIASSVLTAVVVVALG